MDIAAQDALEYIPPPLEQSWGLLKYIIQTASDLPRNTQKALHFISRVAEILNALRKPFSKPPLDLDDLMNAMESLRTLEWTLIETKSLIEQEARLSTTFSEQSKSTWFEHRDRLYKLITVLYASEFNPPYGWEEELKEVARVDDHLWVGLIAHDMWDRTDVKDAAPAEQLAAKLLEEPQNEKEAIGRNREIERVMETWELIQEHPHLSSPFFDFSSFGPIRSGSTSRIPSRAGSPTPRSRRNSVLKTLQRVTSQRRRSASFTGLPHGEPLSDGESGPKPYRQGLPASWKGGKTEPWQNQADVSPTPSRKQTDAAPGPSNAQQSESTTDPVSSITNPTKMVSLSSDPDLRRAAGRAIDAGEAQDAPADEGAQE